MPIKEFVDTVGPFRGMRYSHSFEPDPAYCEFIKNGLPLDPVNGGPIGERPAMSRGPSTAFGTGAGVIQLVYLYSQTDGTNINVVIADGVIYEWNASNLLTKIEMVTQANFATAGVTLSTTAACYAVTLNNTIIVSDGTNAPFSWDGTAGAAGVTALSNCPVLYGQPTIYYAKLFGIKNTARGTIVWSEENDPTTGYEAGGYNNAWELSQSGSEPLIALIGTNEALYFFRERGIGAIRGAVTSTFTTDGTIDGVSVEIGVHERATVHLHKAYIWFLDQFHRPHVLPVGAADPIPLWYDMKRVFDHDAETRLGMGITPDTSGLYGRPDDLSDLYVYGTANTPILPIPGFDLVAFTFASVAGGHDTNSTANDPHYLMLYNTRTFELQAVWVFPQTGRKAGIIWDSQNGRFALGWGCTEGFGFHLGMNLKMSAAFIVDRDKNNAIVDLLMEIVGPQQFNAHDFVFAFDRIDLIMEVVNAISPGIGYYTPAALKNDTTMSVQRFNTTGAKTVGSDFVPTEEHVSVGTKAEGRWIKVYYSSSYKYYQNTGRGQVLGWTVTGYPLSRHPGAR
jgi:hypothetical protein